MTEQLICNCLEYGAIVATSRCNGVSKAQTSDRIRHDVLRWCFELPGRWPRRLQCSGMACLAVWCHCTYFSEACTASVFTAEDYAMPSWAVAKRVTVWGLLERWRTKQRAQPNTWCIDSYVHGVISQKTFCVFQCTHSGSCHVLVVNCAAVRFQSANAAVCVEVQDWAIH